jgi:hypothetical protein
MGHLVEKVLATAVLGFYTYALWGHGTNISH